MFSRNGPSQHNSNINVVKSGENLIINSPRLAQSGRLISPVYTSSSTIPIHTTSENDKSKSVEELPHLQKLDSTEQKMLRLSLKIDERYPSEYAAGRFTDPKQVKAIVEKLVDKKDIPEEKLLELITQYLTQMGEALSSHASMGRKTSLRSENNPSQLHETCIIESGDPQNNVKSAMRFARKTVHKRRPSPPPKPKLTVPSHIIEQPSRPPERDILEVRENLTTLLRSRSVRQRREALAASSRLSDSLEVEKQFKKQEQQPKVSRRQILEESLIAEVAQARHAWYAGGMTKLRAEVRVVVVGAGLAGLSAAADLLRRGFKDIVVLEASERVGGRLHSVCLYDASKNDTSTFESSKMVGLATPQHAELGAPAWVNADPTHAVYELATRCELILWNQPHKRYQCQVMTADGKRLNETVVLSALRFFAHLERDTQILASYQHGCSSLAYSDYTRVRRRHLLAGMQKNEETDLGLAVDAIATIWQLAPGDSDGSMAADLRGQYATTTADTLLTNEMHIPSEKNSPSMKSFSEFSSGLHLDKVKQPSQVSFESTDKLIDSLIEKFPTGMVQLQKRVRCVDWTSFCNQSARRESVRKVKIVCDDDVIYYADHVIITVPLGHLKKFAGDMFKPSLPHYKLEAMNKIGVGTVSKIILYYSFPPWKLPFYLIWSGKRKDDPDTYADSLSSCCLQLLASQGNPGVLEVTLMGNMPEAAVKNDAHVAREITFILETFLSKPKFKKPFPPPDNIVRSFWGENPLFNGSHPYLKRGCKNKDVEHLANSINFRKIPVIQFAGDYTWPDYTRLTHAARSSGLREAERLSQFYNKYFGYENKNPLSSHFDR